MSIFSKLKGFTPIEYETAIEIRDLCKKYNLPHPEMGETYGEALKKVLNCMKHMDSLIINKEK